jgi:PEP-CTERM motif
VPKFQFKMQAASCALLLVVVLLIPSRAGAQNPPSGAIFDLATSSQLAASGVLDTPTVFTTSFVGDGNTEFVSFAFREAPAYFLFDNALVVASGSSTNLLLNPGFEQGATSGPADLNSNIPDNWGRWIQPVDTAAIGQVASITSPFGCSNELAAASGVQFWCDGSVQGYDGIFQGIATTLGTTYNISFTLDDNSGALINNPSIDTLVYAGDQIPVGTVPIAPPPSVTPEPASLALMVGGLGVIGFASRKRTRKI